MSVVLAVIATVLVALPAAASAQAPAGGAIELRAGDGETLRIERSPFRVALVDRGGRATVATVRGREGAPVRVPGIDGPQPAEPLGAAGGFPAMGFVVGTSPGVTFPVSFFTGNRLFGAEAGALVSLVEVERVERRPSGLELSVRTDAPALGPATLDVKRLSNGGATLDLRPPPQLEPVATMFTLSSPPGEGLYGLGARKDDFDQRGSLRNVWVEQQNASDDRLDELVGVPPGGPTGEEYTFPNGAQAAYYVQAALHGSRGWAAWVTQSALSRIDLAASRGDAVRWGVKSPRLTLSLAGGGLEEASRSYTAEVGRAPAPPRYVYEPWIDVINEGEGEAAPNGQGFSGGERVKRDLERIVRVARREDIPIGTLGVEGWQEVPGRRRFFARLRRRGFHLSAYWNPFHSSGNAAYEEALRKGLFIETPTGDPYPLVTNRGGRSFAIDYSHPGALRYWKDQIERSCDLGFEAFMHDFGEFVTEGMRFYNGNPPELEHNAYPVRFHRTARAALERCADHHSGFEPFFYVRAGYSGIEGGSRGAGVTSSALESGEGVIGSTSSVFPGDETTDWAEGSGLPSVPPAMLNLALGGSYTFTTDVGGYLDLLAPRTSPELFTRWSQLAAFTAVSRIHNSTFNGSVYPFSYGERMLRAYRRYARAKVRLIPLVDRWSKRAARKGTIGPVRPLVLEDSSPAARSIEDEWLLGRNILVAPVLDEGARSRSVYLPRGSRWQRVVVDRRGRLRPEGDPERGGRTVTAPAPLADIPIFVRASAADPEPDDGDDDDRDEPGGPAGEDGPGDGRRDPSPGGDRPGRATQYGPVGAGAALASGGSSEDGGLPFTGLPLAGLALLGGTLLVAGMLVRSRRDPGSRGRL